MEAELVWTEKGLKLGDQEHLFVAVDPGVFSKACSAFDLSSDAYGMLRSAKMALSSGNADYHDDCAGNALGLCRGTRKLEDLVVRDASAFAAFFQPPVPVEKFGIEGLIRFALEAAGHLRAPRPQPKPKAKPKKEPKPLPGL